LDLLGRTLGKSLKLVAIFWIKLAFKRRQNRDAFSPSFPLSRLASRALSC